MRRAHSFITGTRHVGGVRTLLRLYYRMGFSLAVYFLKRMPEILRVYTRRSYAREDWEPGMSDIDLFILIALPDGDEARFNARFNGLYGGLKTFFPFMGEVQMGTETELRLYLEHGDVRSREAAAEWKLCYRRHGGTEEPFPHAAPRDGLKKAWEAFTECVHSYAYLSQLYFVPEDAAPARLARNASNKLLDALRYHEWFKKGDFDRPVLSRKDMRAALTAGPGGQSSMILPDMDSCATSRSLRRQVLDSCRLVHAALAEFSGRLLELTVKRVPGQVESVRARMMDDGRSPRNAVRVLLGQCGPLIEQIWFQEESHVYVIVPEASDPDSLGSVFHALFYARCQGVELGALPLVLTWQAYNAVAMSPYLDWPLKQDGMRCAVRPKREGKLQQWKLGSPFLGELILESTSHARICRRTGLISPYASDLENYILRNISGP